MIQYLCCLLLILGCGGCAPFLPLYEGERYSDYVEFSQTEDGLYAEMDLMLSEDSSPHNADIVFWAPLTVTDEDIVAAKIGYQFSNRDYSDLELKCTAAGYAHDRSGFQGLCRIFVLSQTDSWEISEEKLVFLNGLKTFGRDLFKDSDTPIIQDCYCPTDGWRPTNLKRRMAKLSEPLKKGTPYKVKILITGDDPENLPKGFFVQVLSYENPFEHCQGKGTESWKQVHEDNNSEHEKEETTIPSI